MGQWINLSYANVATTSPEAHRVASEWADSLARGGAAEFDGEAEKNGMMPLRNASSKLLSCEVRDVCVGSNARLAQLHGPPYRIKHRLYQILHSPPAYPWSVATESSAEVRLADHDENLTPG